MVLPSPGKELVLAQWKPFLHVLRTAFSHQLTMETTTANQRAKDGSALLYWSELHYWTDIHTTRASLLLFSSSWEKWLPHAITQCQMLCLYSAVSTPSSDYSLANKKSNSKKSSSKPQKRFFPYHRAYVHAILKVHILSEKLENMKSFVIFCLHSSHSARNSFHFHEFFWQNFVQKIWHEKLLKINEIGIWVIQNLHFGLNLHF